VPVISITRLVRVVDVAPTSLVIEITGTEEKIDGLLEVLRHYGVIEMVRTGRVGMSRGSNGGAVAVAAPPPMDTEDGMVAFSV